MVSLPKDIEAWCAIFDFERLADLKKYCRKVTLEGSDLANLIIAAKYPGPFCHLPVFKHHHPDHLELTDDNLKSFGTLKVGEKPNAEALKTFRKVEQMFVERRLFCGHLFWWIEDPDTLPKAWHFFHFDDKSTSSRSNHWKHGSHIHLMNHLTHPNLPLVDLLRQLEDEPRPWAWWGASHPVSEIGESMQPETSDALIEEGKDGLLAGASIQILIAGYPTWLAITALWTSRDPLLHATLQDNSAILFARESLLGVRFGPVEEGRADD